MTMSFEPIRCAARRQPRCTMPVSFYGLAVYSIFYLSLLVAVMPTLASANILTGCASSFDPNTDYFPDKAGVDDADLFTIEYFKYYKVLTDLMPNKTYVLYQCGTQIPSGYDGYPKIPVPVSTAGASQSTDVPMLEMLGKRGAIKYIDSYLYVSSPCLNKQIALGETESLSSNNTIKDTQIASVDIFFNAGNAPNSIATSVVSDPGPNHRAEWILFYAAFFNQEKLAEEISTDIRNNYDCFKNNAQLLEGRPVVAWVNYDRPASWNGYQASWEISVAAYKRAYTYDAGAILFEPAVTKYTTTDAIKEALLNVDILIDETWQDDTLSDFLQSFGLSITSPHKFIIHENVWKVDKLTNQYDALDWFEGAVVEPDAVLQDLIYAFHPGSLPNYSTTWLRHLSKDEGQIETTIEHCPDVQAAYVRHSKTCEPLSPTPTSASMMNVPMIATVVTLLVACVVQLV